MTTLYQKAKNLLFDEYHKNFKMVKNDDYFCDYMNEKFKHSLQVAGVGNGILHNETYFQNKSPEFIEIAKTAILLHDVFRFREIKILYETGQKLDHGVKGSEMLKFIPDFNNILISLPIKHHGHMIEELYNDDEYKSIADEQVKEDVKHIAFAVRDADKIANWQYLMTDFENVKTFWFKNTERTSVAEMYVTPTVWQSFINQEVIEKKWVETNVDTMLSALSWLFDINYKYSITYCIKLDLFNKFYKAIQSQGMKTNNLLEIKKVVNRFVKNKFDLNV